MNIILFEYSSETYKVYFLGVAFEQSLQKCIIQIVKSKKIIYFDAEYIEIIKGLKNNTFINIL